jgi:hypothetical protein
MQRRKRAAAAQGCEVSFVPTTVFLLAMAHADVNRDAPPAPPGPAALVHGPHHTPPPALGSASGRHGPASPSARARSSARYTSLDALHQATSSLHTARERESHTYFTFIQPSCPGSDFRAPVLRCNLFSFFRFHTHGTRVY